MRDHNDSPVMWRPARPVSRKMTDREASLLEVLEKDPMAVKAAARLVAADPVLREIAKALWRWGNLTVGDHFYSPRPPKGGKSGRPRASIITNLERQAETEFIRKAVEVFRRAIVAGRPPAKIKMDVQGAQPKNVAADVVWARKGREKELTDREDCGPGVKLHTPKQWAARAYLRSTNGDDAWPSVDALLGRIEAGGRLADTTGAFRKRLEAAMKASRKRPGLD